ncbi:uncharacterized protein LOC106874457 [Octopus bimaculoides]|uniref:uncharacterized protein LOC106874457 n=1 Tax=Octopus bimaculoides TaxID=37653 RepID=UPI00071E3D14|nr:uncharacterized protein LOC106874457 [Octopus bimaculoides]|eukprot:XP_014777682.1 PREDICTED: uncharacterized protein LOC106874457 [Octopus bimaculoides]
MEKVREKNQELLLIFVDLTKDFDTFNRQIQWKVLKNLGIPDKMLNVIVYHDGMKAAVVSGGESSASFDVRNGTKQGCAIDPILFALFWYVVGDVQSSVKFQFRTSGGLFNYQRFKTRTLPCTSIIWDLLFSADAALIATSLAEVRKLLDRFSAACIAFGLTISTKKTEVIHQNCLTPKQIRCVMRMTPDDNLPDTPIQVDGKSLHYLKSCTYLGSKVNLNAFLDG